MHILTHFSGVPIKKGRGEGGTVKDYSSLSSTHILLLAWLFPNIYLKQLQVPTSCVSASNAFHSAPTMNRFERHSLDVTPVTPMTQDWMPTNTLITCSNLLLQTLFCQSIHPAYSRILHSRSADNTLFFKSHFTCFCCFHLMSRMF